ncbi:peptidylprolyl isomerase [Pseudooceanicola sp.]|uniref:peptidylprolyl isomerase n=1 Tax=Pseudooceanicola sp. TaxID=1914328 RepID=UPI00260160A6|nr:peptidylprolyl isomerase [Pseudooceanicola sp.]MDF1855440.1 SurA N-terminal domain-containing protein [Pseudooceanicola sp.]
MAAKKASQTVVWIIMALLVLGLGGFGVTNFSGTIRTIGSVGDKEIDVDTYASALREELRAIEAQTGQPLSFDQAEQLGLVDATLSRVITARAFDNETASLGISVGDATLAQQLQSIQAFQGIDGKFDREAYKFALERSGTTETRFETRLREETARTLLQGAVVSGAGMSGTFAETLLNYLAETRKVSWIRLDETALDAPIPEPSQDELQAFYEAHIDRYTIPARKQITYAWLTPDMLTDSVEIDQETLDKAYADRRSEFERPERRLVERLIYPDSAAATAARDRLDSGAVDFDTLVEERGLALSDIDLGDVTEAELASVGAAVFAAESGAVVGPLDTDLGPALFRINGVFPAQTVEHADAIEIIRLELIGDRAQRLVEQQMETIEDLLAGGATLEELVDETDMQLGKIDWYAGFNEDISAYDGFDDAAAKLEEDDYPEINQLEDGGIFAMRLEGTLAAEPAPLSEVISRVQSSWETEQTLIQLRDKAAGLRDRLLESADFDTLGLEVTVEEALTRNGSVLGAPETFVAEAFAMKPGEVRITEGFGSVQILRLDAVLPPSDLDDSTGQLRAGLQEAASQSLGQDLYIAFANDLRARAGVTLDQSAINAVHASFR